MVVRNISISGNMFIQDVSFLKGPTVTVDKGCRDGSKKPIVNVSNLKNSSGTVGFTDYIFSNLNILFISCYVNYKLN